MGSKFYWIRHDRGIGLTINLLNSMAPSNHIATGGFGGRASWIFSKFDPECP